MKRAPRHHVFHVHRGIKYHVEDSLRGVLFAIRHLFGWIDLDMHVTKDGVLVVTHWSRPQRRDGFGYRLLRGRLRRTKLMLPIEKMTWAQISTLRTKDHYRIWRADVLIPYAIRHGIRVEAEAKTPHITRQLWADLLAAVPAGRRDWLWAKAFPKFGPSLEAAHEEGITTLVLLHTRRDVATLRAMASKVPTSTYTYYRGRSPHAA